MKILVKRVAFRGPFTLLPDNVLEHASSLTLSILKGKRQVKWRVIVICVQSHGSEKSRIMYLQMKSITLKLNYNEVNKIVLVTFKCIT